MDDVAYFILFMINLMKKLINESLSSIYKIIMLNTLSTHQFTWNISDLCETLTNQSKRDIHNYPSWMQSIEI